MDATTTTSTTRRKPELRITHWINPTEIIESGYGSITGAEWCKWEAQRATIKGNAVYVKTRTRDGWLALCRGSNAKVRL